MISRTLPVLLLVCIIGCQPRGQAPQAQQLQSQDIPPQLRPDDPCAMRLQDLCGAQLLYYLMNDALPEALEDLPLSPGMSEGIELRCPASGAPYIYNPEGIYLPERNARVIVYDGVPTHLGLRWAIQIDEPEIGRPLVAKVIALPERFFVLRSAR
ncbi:MAG TPA: hypothetical protein PKB10_03550 [Tepidisphaeraceae bacterium]|nr:hypothetical protein [Tepidisphaeraceae bacterium]